jgi:hypothetical protein
VPRDYLTHLLETTQKALVQSENAQRTREKDARKPRGYKALAGPGWLWRKYGVYLTAARRKNIVHRMGVLKETRNGCYEPASIKWPNVGPATSCML